MVVKRQAEEAVKRGVNYGDASRLNKTNSEKFTQS